MSQQNTNPANWYAVVDKTLDTDDQRIENITVLPPPEHLIRFFPIAGTPTESLIGKTRKKIRDIIHGKDDRLLVIIGPCSIHDPSAALEYCQRLVAERERFAGELEIVMRVYFEKPRTTVGWKGLINDPYLDESYRIEEGLRMGRQVLMEINRLGMPAGSEFLDVISPQYIADLISWGAIGARTTESQIHRELASGLSAPIGFKNGTDGNIKIATDAIQAASRPHHFLSVHKNGQVSIVETKGNKDCHVILRGGKEPNYEAKFVQEACAELAAAKLPARLMVDLSHANSSKKHERQIVVAENIAEQIESGSQQIFGVMIESHLIEGAQKFSPGKDDPRKLTYGQSITDACINWEDSVNVLQRLALAVKNSRKAKK
ncbi:3-deoxy-7-phosphoheptulonate synthase [Polynucleobacter antarcticus]|uniref:Phospho-2-dehydro-3-deoxyheptonate aldolase n=1 Tax=Polynucleobacter antarcticus TaxID=1743162 RepID=A0A6M9PTU5_9BURK|nr:3-deoxy-7-phosphoheptulonate synthase [Polynucleobacter antarcticus]QKM63272.1 3-deoxy-7-phosphoheptulonate synthase [Polynucleobacter antarcticus]